MNYTSLTNDRAWIDFNFQPAKPAPRRAIAINQPVTWQKLRSDDERVELFEVLLRSALVLIVLSSMVIGALL